MADSKKSLSSFKAFGFDVMGTLLDERIGIWDACKPLHTYLSSSSRPDDVQHAINEALSRLMKSGPAGTSYESIMAKAYSEVTDNLTKGQYSPSSEESLGFARSLAEWPLWPDTFASLEQLSSKSDLYLVSNMDTTTLQRIATEGPLKGIRFAALIGSDQSKAFKPDQRVNQTMLDRAKQHSGIGKDEILLVAQGTASDHVPARDMGIASAWIDRYDQGQDAIGRLGLKPTYVFKSLAELVAQRDEEMRSKR
ncbi:hypothetical protein KVT40_000289 [Elsinoe batatas]|uniref:Uncharacterized protein n=1 Tax=Elsinoe batatas TaxID=2601811 RepID=A0A8K0L9U4_9PEZI|nr:hypothetical protein KVT40_000289 [Elsinoe batatas]